jgi:hypothetical protein
MPSRINGHTDINEVSEKMANTEINGSRKKRGLLHRKQSSPMMPPFMVSAPGKVIAFGEHAVVHGKVQSNCYCLSTSANNPFSGSYRSSYFSTLISPRHSSLKIKKNHLSPISRHKLFAHMEHRRPAMEQIFCAGKEEILLRFSHKS